MAIYNFLEIGLLHLDERDVQILETYDPYALSPQASVSAHLYQWGYDISIAFMNRDPADVIEHRFGEMRTEGFSPFLAAALWHANLNGCCRVRVDVEGDYEPSLPIVHQDFMDSDDRAPDPTILRQHLGLTYDPESPARSCLETPGSDAVERLFLQAARGDKNAAFALKEAKRHAPETYRDAANVCFHSVLADRSELVLSM